MFQSILASGNNHKNMWHLLFQLNLILGNNNTNHIILPVPIKIRHDGWCLVNKTECKAGTKLKRILHSKLGQF